jgi:hypothetical protein
MVTKTVSPAAWTARTGLGNASSREADTRANITSRLRFQRLVERLHALGPAPLGHFIRDLESGKPLQQTLEAYADLPADFIAALSGDRFTPYLLAIDGGAP